MHWPAMAESLLTDIRREDYHVGTVKVLDRETGEVVHMIDATDAKPGERWSVQAADESDAVVELAVQLGWDFEE